LVSRFAVLLCVGVLLGGGFAQAAPDDLPAKMARIDAASGPDKLRITVETLRSTRTGDPKAMAALVDTYLDLARRHGDERASGYCWFRKGSAALWLEQDETAARAALLEARRLAERTGDGDVLYDSLYYLGYIAIRAEHFVEGIDYWSQAVDTAVARQSYSKASVALGDMALVFAEFNDLIEADRLYLESKRYADLSGDTFARRGAELAFANHKSYSGEHAAAIAAYRRVIENPDGWAPPPRPLDLVQAWGGMATSAALSGAPNAKLYAKRAMAIAEADASPYLLGWARLAEARVAIAENDIPTATKAVDALIASGRGDVSISSDEERFSELQADLHAMRGEYRLAYQHLKDAYQRAKDLARRKAVQTAAVARARAEIKSQDAALALAEADARMARAAVQRRNHFLILAAVALGLVSLLGAVAWVLFRRARAAASALTESNAEIRAQARMLDRSLQEKQVLLREINHRVKNNLQTISSLVEMQAQQLAHSQDAQAAHVLREVYGRIETMSVLQKQLFELDGAPFVQTRAFITDMLHGLAHLFDKPIRLNLDVEDIDLDVRVASPLGLILNEFASNALEHAFKTGTDGRLDVRFRTQGREHVLEVIDDGFGLPADFNIETSPSMGLKLVRSLTRQLHGRVSLVPSERGAYWKVCFPAESRFWPSPQPSPAGA